MKQVPIRKFRHDAAKYMDDLPIILTRHNIPVAQVTKIYQEKATTKAIASVEQVTEADIDEIAKKYTVNPAFVRFELEALKNYCLSSGKRYKNYKAALQNFVLRDMKKHLERRFDAKPAINATGLSK